MNIRGVAQTEIVSNEDGGNNNPFAQTLNRESNFSRELFAGRLTEQDLNASSAGVEEDLKEAPHIYSDAVLYKVVHTIDT